MARREGLEEVVGLLTRAGYEVLVASSGDEAVERLARAIAIDRKVRGLLSGLPEFRELLSDSRICPVDDAQIAEVESKLDETIIRSNLNCSIKTFNEGSSAASAGWSVV